MLRVNDIKNQFKELLNREDYVTDRTGVKTLEIIGATFLVDQDWIIRPPNYNYIEREIEWYKSKSLYVKDIPGSTPKIWEDISSTAGEINSNYGWCIYSEENGSQYKNVLKELKSNPNSRRGVMLYNRPAMHTDYNKNGMNDFVCTYSNTFYIRDGKLHSHYLMRSTDIIFGFNNDVAWAKFVQQQLANDLNLEIGDLIWTSSNIHMYERHFQYLQDDT